MKNRRKEQLLFINVVSVAALLVVMFPLLLIAQYNYPTADDWSFGVYGYNVIQQGGNLWDVIVASFKMMVESYNNWEGRFIAVLFASFQPGIWGEQWYGIVAWIMIGAIICSELFLFKAILCNSMCRENRWFWMPVIIPMLIMQMLYCPSPEESFYWYTGAVNYTFVHCLSLVLLVCFVRLGLSEYSKGKYISLAVVTSVLAVCVGGNNFATSLYSVLTLWIISVLFGIYKKSALKRTWYVTVLTTVSLVLCIVAPGNAKRISGNFGGETGGAVEAVVMSLVRTATNIYSWTNVKILLVILFVLPFVWLCVKNIKFAFRFPAVFTVLSFGVYASQITATMYVDGTTGGGRMAAILYYSYCIWLLLNVIYWVGWINRKVPKIIDIAERIRSKVGKYLVCYCALIGIFLVAVIYVSDLREITTYRAYRNWRQGWAQQYAAEWDARIEVLHNTEIQDVVFEPITVYPEMIMYTDLQDENGFVWVNSACAEYYGKSSITVEKKQN